MKLLLILLCLLMLALIASIALTSRYQYIPESNYAMDRWTGKVVELRP